MIKLLMNIYFLEKKLSEELKVRKIKKIYNNFDDLHFIVDDSIVERINESLKKLY